MRPGPVGPEAFRRRLVGLYALTVMDREGPLHGYGLSERIAERTEGAWRPGPGSVYPSLRKLVEHGLALRSERGRRRLYTITPAGRTFLRGLRRPTGESRRTRPDLSALWAEVFGASNVEAFRLERLRRSLSAMEAQIAHASGSVEGASLRSVVLAELTASASRIRTTPAERPSRPRIARKGAP
ncbi:MAG: PadR family transcriptional regulator [Thermoplasmata archaeon]|nr:PadR family transcriptional regulator [Thermoplasmata archaeon]